MPASTRDLDEVLATFARWYAGRHPDVGDPAVSGSPLQGGGYSNEVFFVDVTGGAGGDRRSLVLRLPPSGPALFPTYDLELEAAVQRAASAVGVPVPDPVEVEADPGWFGVPFVVMPRVEGRIPGEIPVLDPWIAELSTEDQRRLHAGFFDTVAAVHRTPWAGTPLVDVLRGADGSLAAEMTWWRELADWAFDGEPPGVLVEQLDACDASRPAADQVPSPAVLWGDVRMGNVVFAADGTDPVSVLDWEMASLGPPEHDIAWYTALTAVAEHFLDVRLPGFLSRHEIHERFAAALGRPLVDIDWFERFALTRAALINMRADRLAAARDGTAPPDPASNPVLTYLRHRWT